MKSDIYLGLGSNIGDRIKYLTDAVQLIKEKCNINIASSVYESIAYGFDDQENYYNAVISIETNFKFSELYKFVKEIEHSLGRKESQKRWAPREIDVDILFYNNVIYSNDMLNIPHKEILNRDFVLVPLKEICGNFVHPVLNIKIKDLDLSQLKNHIVKKLDYKLN